MGRRGREDGQHFQLVGHDRDAETLRYRLGLALAAAARLAERLHPSMTRAQLHQMRAISMMKKESLVFFYLAYTLQSYEE